MKYMDDSPLSPELLRAAERARIQPFFLATALYAYQVAHKLDDAALAQMLGCSLAQLPLLALCQRPTGDAPQVARAITPLIVRFGLQRDALLAVLCAGGDDPTAHRPA